MVKSFQKTIVDLVFSGDGLLSKYLTDFEEREIQKEMVRTLFKAYEENKIALVEAGTGTGKSFAYLVPALFWSAQFQEKTIISTHTIALQEQLVKKDIPFLLKVLDLELKVVLVKGMENYLCLRKYDTFRDGNTLLEARLVDKLDQWVGSTDDGSRSSYSGTISETNWTEIKAERENCTHNKCPFFKECFFFKARKKVHAAQILVVNHHLFFSDKYMKSQGSVEDDKSLLPLSERVIIDEAHHIEEVISQTFSSRVDQIAIYSLLARQSALLLAITTILNKAPLSDAETIAFKLQLELEMGAKKGEIIQKVSDAFFFLDLFCSQQIRQKSDSGDQRFRLTDEIISTSVWKEEVGVYFRAFLRAVKDQITELEMVEKKLTKITDGDGQVVALELQSILRRWRDLASAIDLFFADPRRADMVQWVEGRASGGQVYYQLNNRPLEVDTLLSEHLFDAHQSVLLCSATLSTGGNFNFLKSRLGIGQRDDVLEGSYPSPFDYASRALFGAPSDICDPTDPDFNAQVAEIICESSLIADGGVFALFTSYTMLEDCYRRSAEILEEAGFTIFKQGDRPRTVLLEEFKAAEKPILFGTDSFWEGVDVAGEALRLVIIAKIPFKVPTDPLVQAYSEKLQMEGRDPFFHYLIPHAVMKLKQGFGRLIRKSEDRGCVICLDKRIFTKSYGKEFLKSLPPAAVHFETKKKLYQVMRELYQRTEITS